MSKRRSKESSGFEAALARAKQQQIADELKKKKETRDLQNQAERVKQLEAQKDQEMIDICGPVIRPMLETVQSLYFSDQITEIKEDSQGGIYTVQLKYQYTPESDYGRDTSYYARSITVRVLRDNNQIYVDSQLHAYDSNLRAKVSENLFIVEQLSSSSIKGKGSSGKRRKFVGWDEIVTIHDQNIKQKLESYILAVLGLNKEYVFKERASTRRK